MILPVAVLKGIMIKYEKDEEKEVKLLKAKYVQRAYFAWFSVGGGVGGGVDDGVKCKDPCVRLTWSGSDSALLAHTVSVDRLKVGFSAPSTMMILYQGESVGGRARNADWFVSVY